MQSAPARFLSAHRVGGILLVALAGCLLGVAPARGQGTHRVDYVGPAFSVVEINEQGVCVGTEISNGNVFVGWVWSPLEGRRTLPLPPGMTSAVPWDINEQGVIVGDVRTNIYQEPGYAAAWYPDGNGWSVVLLDPLPGHQRGAATSINNQGDLVGFCVTPGWQGGPPTWFNGPGGPTNLNPYGFTARPSGINEARQVCGGQLRLDLDTMVTEDLGVPPPIGTMHFQWVVAAAINEHGSVTGYGMLATSLPDNRRVVRHTDDAGWQVLDNLPTRASGGLDINDQDQVVSQTPAASTFNGPLAPIENLIRPEDQAWSVLDMYYSLATNNAGEVLAMGTNSITGHFGAVRLAPGGAATVEPIAGSAAASRIAGIAPNPMQASTRIAFDLPAAAVGHIGVYDLSGRRVRTLRAGELSAGAWALEWNGDDENGHRVAAGTYFLRLEWAGVREQRPLVVVR